MVTLIIFFLIYFLIKVEITLLNNVNLIDCFTFTFTLNPTEHAFHQLKKKAKAETSKQATVEHGLGKAF